MFKFIHAADLHLDSPLLGLERYPGAPVAAIRCATRRALENLVQLAVEQSVDFVIIAGDVYDGDWKDHHTGLFFVNQMSRLRAAAIPVVMIAGNHDAANRMTKTLKLPDNVECLSSESAVTASHPLFAKLGVAIHGRSYAEPAETENLALGYPAAQVGRFNIGVLHSSLVGTTGHDPYAPCSLDDLKSKNYQYWALGHIHCRQVICEEPWVVYSGNTQGRHSRELDAKGCYLVTVDEQGRANLKFETLDVFRWTVCRIDTSRLQSLADLWNEFREQLARARKLHPGYPLAVRIEVLGTCVFHAQLHAESERVTHEFRAAAMELALDEVWIEKIKFLTEPVGSRLGSGDGPIDDVHNFVELLREDPTELALLLSELSDLKRKLPFELTYELGDLTNTTNPLVRNWLESAEAIIMQHLGVQKSE
ncbi:MAG: DNA repair exonuclease [Planctomycetaceae bacterium]|nr:DNA repair exonuclease [Planctomycetaceae bacterium]